MAKGFRPVRRDQPMLLAPDVREWVPADHLVWVVIEVVEGLDTSRLAARAGRSRAGRAGFDPVMLLTLLVYAYCQKVTSSRQIERLCRTETSFMLVCGLDAPDHSVIARFRQDHQQEFAALFTRVLKVAAQAGLGQLGTVAIDGTKIAANASLDANHRQDWYGEQVALLLEDAEQVDAAEDTRYGPRRGDELPPGMGDRSGRRQRLDQASRQIAEQEAAAERATAERGARDEARVESARVGHGTEGRSASPQVRLAEAEALYEHAVTGQQARIDAYQAKCDQARQDGRDRPRGRPAKSLADSAKVRQALQVLHAAREAVAAAHERAAAREDEHDPDAGGGRSRTSALRANATDPQSRIMPTRRGWVQGYNTQIVASADQLILATDVVQDTSDWGQFTPMLAKTMQAADLITAAPGRAGECIGHVLADAGYATDDALASVGPDRLIALGKSYQVQNQAGTTEGDPPSGATPRQAMAHRIRTTEGATTYKRRGATVEPAIGNLKKILHRFSRRGLDAARAETHLAAAAFNLRKIHNHQIATA